MMQYNGYVARIEFDAEANIFHGEVVNIVTSLLFKESRLKN